MNGASTVTRGKATEREACRLLTELTGWTVRRRASEGIREDIGDLIGVPDTTIQVSAVRPLPAAIWERARTKIADCAAQQQRHGMTHGVVLLRIDGKGGAPAWRALCSAAQIEALDVHRIDCEPEVTPGSVIRWAPYWAHPWVLVGAGIYVTSVDRWAADIACITKAAA